MNDITLSENSLNLASSVATKPELLTDTLFGDALYFMFPKPCFCEPQIWLFSLVFYFSDLYVVNYEFARVRFPDLRYVSFPYICII